MKKWGEIIGNYKSYGGINMGKKIGFTKEMDEFLMKNFLVMKLEEIATMLGVSRFVVANRAKELNLEKIAIVRKSIIDQETLSNHEHDYLEMVDRINNLKKHIKVGDRVLGRKVLSISKNFIVVKIGTYRDTYTWQELYSKGVKR